MITHWSQTDLWHAVNSHSVCLTVVNNRTHFRPRIFRITGTTGWQPGHMRSLHLQTHWKLRHNEHKCLYVVPQCHWHQTHKHKHCTLCLHNLHAERRAGNWLKLGCCTNDSRQRTWGVEKWHFTGSSSKRIKKQKIRLYNIINNNSNYYYYYYYYLLLLSFHSVAVVLTLVQTKLIRINIHKRNNKKTMYNQYTTQ